MRNFWQKNKSHGKTSGAPAIKVYNNLCLSFIINTYTKAKLFQLSINKTKLTIIISTLKMDKTNVEMWISIIFINKKSSIFYSFKYFVSTGMKNCPVDGENFATFLNNSDIGTTKMTLGVNNWDVETYGNKLEKLTELTTYYFNVNWKKL